eukprot:TRINITY_DN2265_c0_g3_i1.p1 TRINITY_DN2265_c0_g3~~TRINITY_DN2265_c0_g3_i1.p1  ORF type:complete len:240 (-),score=37.02 TRINITY_DN2265_c0_g3_i1:249-968(-)
MAKIVHGLSLEESDDDEEFSSDGGWIAWYCGLKGHDMFAEVEDDYIRDPFNLYGLRNRFQFYDHALEMILSQEPPDEQDLEDPEFMELCRDATDLYGLIHARYIISPHGLQEMREKYLRGSFGKCPRVHCDNQHVIPTGLSDDLRAAVMKMYCPKCEQVYSVKHKYKDIDGVYFGTSFPQVFFMSYPSLLPRDPPRPFVPRVFGFKLHKQKSMIAWKLEQEQQSSAAQPSQKSGSTEPC